MAHDTTLLSSEWSTLQQQTAPAASLATQASPTTTVRLDVIDSGRNWVRTKVVDAESGELLPCRIHFRSPAGVPFLPYGHNSRLITNFHTDIGGDVLIGEVPYAYINGECEGWLPRGEVLVDVAKGFEYQPLRTQVEIVPGQQTLTITLKQFVDMGKERYFSGDTHVHFLSAQGAHLEAAGEGVGVVNVLQSQWGSLFTNTEEFTGRPSVAPNGKSIVYVSQENRQHLLGHLSLLGLVKPIMPWCVDGPTEGEIGGALETTLSRWADECRAQGGTTIIPHMPVPNGEVAALVVSGRVDAAEMVVHDAYMHEEYYRYLNAGFRLPLAGGTDKMTSDVPVGIFRTYVHIPADEPFTYDNWCRGLRRGNTFVSSGPLLRLCVEGHTIGDTVRLSAGGGCIEVEAVADSNIPINCLEIIINGRVVDRTQVTNGAHHLHLKSTVRITRHSWITARCAGPNYAPINHHTRSRRGVMAHTSPIYLAVGEDWWMFDQQIATYLLTMMQGSLDYIHHRSPQWEPQHVTHRHGLNDHIAYLTEPILEAMAIIHQRMHALGLQH
ncbi:MAG: CehA/McbA family metallohydrolase [Kiritimatiellia bacterium]